MFTKKQNKSNRQVFLIFLSLVFYVGANNYEKKDGYLKLFIAMGIIDIHTIENKKNSTQKEHIID